MYAQAAETMEQDPILLNDRWQPVPRLSGPEAVAYLATVKEPSHPVVLENVMLGRMAMEWTPEFFKLNFPEVRKEVDGRMVSLPEQIDHILASSERSPAPYPYAVDLKREAPDLLHDLEPFLSFGRTDRTLHPMVPRFLLGGTIVHELFFGGLGSRYPILHYDALGMHTQSTQVFGRKEFYLFSPSQTALLYPYDDNPRVSRIGNMFQADLERFPLFAQARGMRTMLNAGDTLFFPRGWWHATYMPGPSITYGRAVVNASNWNVMMTESLHRWRTGRSPATLPAYAYGRLLGAAFDLFGR